MLLNLFFLEQILFRYNLNNFLPSAIYCLDDPLMPICDQISCDLYIDVSINYSYIFDKKKRK